MTKTVTLRLEEGVFEEFRKAAAAEGWTLSHLIETAALARIRERQFVGDEEVTEILSNHALLGRLKAGSLQARLRQGDYVA